MATGDITAAVISGTAPKDGWVIELTVEGWSAKTVSAVDCGWTPADEQKGNDPDTDTPKCVLSLTSSGFDTSGGATSVARVVYGTKRLRKPYPDQADFDTTVSGSDLIVRIALSDYVYSGDSALSLDCLAALVTASDASTSNAVAALAVTNSSTKAYPKVKAAWIDRASTLPGRRLGDSYAGAAIAEHAYGVAAARFTLSDESTSVEEFVTTRTVLECERTASGTLTKVAAFQASLDITGLADGDAGTARVRVYPRIGDSASVFDSDAFGQGEPQFRTRPHRIRSSATWPDVFVAVDPTNGDDGSGTVSEDEAQADAAPYADMWTALKAIETYIENNLGRANSYDGGVVLLKDNAGDDQDHYWGRTGFSGTYTAASCFLRFRASAENTGRVRFRTDVDFNEVRCTGGILIEQVPIEPVAGDQSNFFGIVNADDWYVLDRCEIKSESTNTLQPLFQSNVENVTRYCCKVEDWYSAGAFGGVWPEAVNLHQPVAVNGGFCVGFKLDANAGGNWTEEPAIKNSVAASDIVIAFFELSTLTEPAFNMAADITNCWFGQGIVRRYSGAVAGSSGTQPLIDMITTPISDCLMEHLTIVGGRCNIQNETSPDHVQERLFIRNSHIHYFAVKADTFASDGSLTGSWATLWGVGQEGIYNGEANVFLQEFPGLCAWGRDATGTRDQGLEDPDFDATPSSGSQLLGLPRASVAEFDLAGTAVGDSPDSGAIQVAAVVGGEQLVQVVAATGVAWQPAGAWGWVRP